MKRLSSVENDQVQLEIMQCDCGFHLGVDATYLDQVGDFVIECPSCHAKIDTAIVFPEWDYINDFQRNLTEADIEASIARNGIKDGVYFNCGYTAYYSFPPTRDILQYFLELGYDYVEDNDSLDEAMSDCTHHWMTHSHG